MTALNVLLIVPAIIATLSVIRLFPVRPLLPIINFFGGYMGKYLDLRDRYAIEDYLRVKMPVKAIASLLGRSFSTIYKEIKKGQVEVVDRYLRPRSVYSAVAAQQRHEQVQTSKGRPIKLGHDYDYARFLEDKIIKEKYSPAAALAAARAAGYKTSVCVATLYSYIDKGYLLSVRNKHLLYKSPKHKPVVAVPRISHPQFPSIEQRPFWVNTRSEPGHWEMDCVCGSQGTRSALLVLVERVTRYTLIFKIPDKTTVSVVSVLDGLERRYPDFRERFKSVTCDNGSEFMDYSGMTKSIRGGLRTEIFYCHPYCSSERGSNENLNRIIRRWVPKSTNISKYSKGYISKVQHWINHYPRRVLGYSSAIDCMNVLLSA